MHPRTAPLVVSAALLGSLAAALPLYHAVVRRNLSAVFIELGKEIPVSP